MSSEDDMNDPELRAAIAASLGQMPEEKPVVDLTADSDDDVIPVFPKSNSLIGSETDSDSEDEALKKAIELSKQSLFANETSEDEVKPDASSRPGRLSDHDPGLSTDQETPKPQGFLGIDRKQMEQERLARLAKRKLEGSSEVEQPQAKSMKIERSPTGEVHGRSLGVRNSIPELQPVTSKTSNREAAPDQIQHHVPSTESTVQFPSGAVKKTWSFGCRRRGDDIKIEEVFQKSDLKVAVLSSFMWEMDWLFSKMNISTTQFALIMQAKDNATKQQYREETATMNHLKLYFPPMEGQVNCMHSKLMVLFHPGHVRIVVPTANLTPYDWGEFGGVMENTVFLIDLPKVAGPDAEGPSTKFKEELVYFLRASTVPEALLSKLHQYDFSKTAHLAFIHSIGGSHIGETRKRTGHCGLGNAVNSLALQTSKPLNIDFVASSLGLLDENFMKSMYLACQGDDGTTAYLLRTAKSFPIANSNNPSQPIHQNTAAEWKDRFRVYFPSLDVVKGSKGGPECAGTVCFQSKWYARPTFPRQVLRDCQSQRAGLLMHNKIMYVRPDEPIQLPDNKQCRAWAYVGSANLSESAWGRLVQDRATKGTKLNCRNWECGVLVPVVEDRPAPAPPSGSETGGDDSSREQSAGPSSGPAQESTRESAHMLDVFGEANIPVPMVLPGARFGSNREPWFFLGTET